MWLSAAKPINFLVGLNTLWALRVTNDIARRTREEPP
jgi:steroid 5-alpha reductase family enzyme